MGNGLHLIQRMLTALTFCLLFLLLAGDRSFFETVDFAHHYALVTRLYEHWSMPTGTDFSLGEMNVYPRYAHALAAVMGTVLGSPFLGMYVIGLLSFIGLWYAVSVMLRHQPDHELALQTPLLLVGLLLAGASGLEIFGNEVTRHYFFAQLAGQALMFATLALWLRLQRFQAPVIVRYGFLAASSVLLVGFHLLPGIELLGVLTLVVGMDFFPAERKSGKAISAGILLIAVATIAILFHPSFAEMKTISSGNGSLPLKFTPTLTALSVLCVVVLSLSAVGLYLSLRSRAPGQQRIDVLGIVAAYGMSVSGLFVIQRLALVFGYGSDYACKKYGFGLNSALLLLVSLLAAKALVGLIRKSPWKERLPRTGGALRPLAAALVLLAAVLPAHRNQGPVDLLRVAEVETAARKFYSKRPTQPDEKRDMAFGIAGMGKIGNYLVSIGSLHHPRDDSAMDVLRHRLPKDLSRKRYLITSGGTGSLNIAECRRYELDGELVAVDAACADKLKGLCRLSTDFSFNSDVSAVALEGLSVPEAFGRWTDGQQARFSCRVPDDMAGKINGVRIVLARGFAPEGSRQKARISVNNATFRDIEIGTRQQEYLLKIDPESVGKMLEVVFDIPGARSPKELGMGEDGRRLGLGLKKIDLLTDYP